MKNIKSIAILAVLFAGILLTGCSDDFLTRDPLDQQVESNFYQSEEDAKEALIAVYDVLQWGAVQGNNPFETISDIVSDDAYAGGANSSDVPFIVKMDEHDMEPATGEIQGFWNKYYTGIYRANLLLQKIDAIEFADSTTKAQYIAEAKFLRATYYFDLARLFGNVPLILNTLSTDEYNQVQDTPEAVYNQIATDLMEAIPHLPESFGSANLGRITKWAAEAQLAKIYLYHSGYVQNALGVGGDMVTADGDVIDKAKAQGLIDDVIANSGHDLLENYADLFDVENENNIESVFEVQYSSKSAWGDWDWRQGSDGNQAVILYGMRDVAESTGYAAGWSFAPVTYSLVNEFDPADPRLEASIIDAEAEGFDYTPGFQNTGYFNKKFQPLIENNPEDGSRELNYPNNYMVIRFADVLLIGAELYLYDDLGKAQQYYSRVVRRAWGEDNYTPPQLTADENGMDLIYHERRVELAGEGHRYWDLLRRGLAYAEEKIDATNGEYPFVVDFDQITKGLFPIPQQEILLSDGRLTQNTGY